MSGLPNPNTLQASQNNVNKVSQSPDHLTKGQEKQQKIVATKDALTGTFGMMNAVTPADQLNWPPERQAAFRDLTAFQTVLNNGEITQEISLTITDKNGIPISKKVREGFSTNEVVSYLQGIPATDTANYEKAQEYLTALNSNSNKSVDIAATRFPTNTDDWVGARIQMEVDKRMDPKNADPRVAGKSPADIRADVVRDFADRKEIVLEELNPAEQKAVSEHEHDLELIQQSSDLAEIASEWAGDMIAGLAQKKNSRTVMFEKGNEILNKKFEDPSNPKPDEVRRKAAAADTLVAMYIFQKIGLSQRLHLPGVKKEMLAVQANINRVRGARKDLELQHAPKANAVTAMATEWVTDPKTQTVMYGREDLRERPALVLNDYIDKVVSNAQVPAIGEDGKQKTDSEGAPAYINVRQQFLDRLLEERKAAALDGARARHVPPTNATPEQTKAAEDAADAEATAVGKKARDSMERKLKVQNVMKKMGAASGPGALIALMMFGKMFKSLAMNLAGVDQQQQQG